MTTATPYFPCWLHLKNGWTVSVSMSDTPPAICSVAAWPSGLDDARHALADFPWFNFGDGRMDQRCWTIDDLRNALKKVEDAPPYHASF